MSAAFLLNLHVLQPVEPTEIAGIEFHLSDELYSENVEDTQIAFGSFEKRALTLVSKLNTVDDPYWFRDEFDGIVHCEALMRAWMPPPSTSWKEMQSDGAMSNLAFAGIGQLYVMHVNGWKQVKEQQEQDGNEIPRGTVPLTYAEELPPHTEYVLDMCFMEKYHVRQNFCRYGGAAFFDKDRTIIGIYVCDVPNVEEPVKKPTDKRKGELIRRDDDEKWEFAKFSLRCTLVSLCTLRDHLCYCHWIVSNRVSIASREALHHNHPVRRVLKVFTFRSVNTFSTFHRPRIYSKLRSST